VPSVAGMRNLVDGSDVASTLNDSGQGRQVSITRRHRWLIRLDPKPPGALAVVVVAVVAALLTGGWMMLGHSHVSAVPSMAGSPSVPAPGAVAGSSSFRQGNLLVDVIGKVHRPGLYRLAAGSRVDDAVRAAGGAITGADLTALNLARKLADGEQLAVGVATAQPPSPSGGGLVDLNTASEAALDALPGVGPVLAQHIVSWRSTHGSFSAVDQLRQVSGIGPAKFADIRRLVTV
jgi:competence protein ComEA